MSSKQLQILNYVIAILLVVVGIAIYVTASTVLSIIFLVLLVVGALNVTGVIGSLFNVKQ